MDEDAGSTAPSPAHPSRNRPFEDSSLGAPEWAKPLRRLYQSVVEEPLPDSFADLLARLDAPPE